jgi:hypothetical protein
MLSKDVNPCDKGSVLGGGINWGVHSAPNKTYRTNPAPKRTANIWQMAVPTAPITIDVFKTLKSDCDRRLPLAAAWLDRCRYDWTNPTVVWNAKSVMIVHDNEGSVLLLLVDSLDTIAGTVMSVV